MAKSTKRNKTKTKPTAKKTGARPVSGAARQKPILESRVSFITIGVRDFLASLAFYRDSLGFRLHMLQGDIAMFDIGGAVLALYPLKLLAEDSGTKPGTGFGGIALAHNVKNKKDVDRVMNAAAERGARILVPAEDKFWGGRSGYFADPDGYPWEIAWNPGIRMDSKGRLVLKQK